MLSIKGNRIMITNTCTTNQRNADIKTYFLNTLNVIDTTYSTIITQFTFKGVTYIHIITIVVIYYL